MKTCFVISPIGEENSDTRKEADQVFNYIIRPAARRYRKELDVKRADHMASPGSITNQVIKMLCDSEIIIAELTGWNPNVMHELAIRHVVNKPTILILSNKESRIPFDLQNERTVRYDTTDLATGTKSADALEAHIEYCLSATDETVWSPSYLNDIVNPQLSDTKRHKKSVSSAQLSPTEISAVTQEMERALAQARELKSLVQNEIAALEQAYKVGETVRENLAGRLHSFEDMFNRSDAELAERLARTTAAIRASTHDAERILSGMSTGVSNVLKQNASEVERTLLSVSAEVARNFVGTADEISTGLSRHADKVTQIVNEAFDRAIRRVGDALASHIIDAAKRIAENTEGITGDRSANARR
jgi:hypothetical protein